MLYISILISILFSVILILLSKYLIESELNSNNKESIIALTSLGQFNQCLDEILDRTKNDFGDTTKLKLESRNLQLGFFKIIDDSDCFDISCKRRLKRSIRKFLVVAVLKRKSESAIGYTVSIDDVKSLYMYFN